MLDKLAGLAVGLTGFGAWMAIFGDPHVAQTVIGIVGGSVIGYWVWWKRVN